MELLIAIAIVGIIAGFAGGASFRGWLAQRGLNSAVEQLRGDMQRAKMMAIKQQDNCSILLNTPGANQYTIASPTGNVVVDLTLYKGSVTFVAGSSALITFNAWGLCTTAGGQIIVTNQLNMSTFRLRTSMAGGISKQVLVNGTWTKSRV